MAKSNRDRPIDRNRRNLTDRQKRAIPILLSPGSKAERCERAGVSRETYYNWMSEEHFRSAFEEQQQEITRDAITSLKLLSQEAVAGLGRLLHSRSEAIRLKAILAVIEHTIFAVQNEMLEQRVSALEKSVEENELD